MANNENVRVVVRCRPMNSKEKQMKCKSIVDIHDCTVNLINPNDVTAPAKSFAFDNVYSERAPTEAIYNDICYSLVESVLEGYNATIFAYGQTGCGKSHTMQGPVQLLGSTDKSEKHLAQSGIISRSFEHIFEAIFVSSDTRYLAFVSFLEIYNENIRDLLCPENSNLQLKEVPGEGITVKNLSSHTVHNSSECENLLLHGAKNLIVGSTDMNAGSSRSHSIFTINLEQISLDRNAVNLIKKGKLNLVDLAGSERQNKTGATGDRLKEATKINLSLSALGNVISALVDGKTKHIPYRDAKLTRLLQDSLGGNTKTLMISCISPADYNYDETLSTLRYASRAKSIHNKPKINEDPKDTIIREYQQEITKLKDLLEKAQLLDNLDVNLITKPERLETNKIITELDDTKEINEILIPIPTQQTDQEVCIRIPKRPLIADDEIKNSYIENSKTTNIAEKPLIISSTKISPSNNVNDNSSLINRLQTIKNSMIGGEKSNDVQLTEKRNKKKLAAQQRLSELTNALNRIEQEEDRDILQVHYTNIQQELQYKTAILKKQRQQVRALEREIIDIQSEFQLDRADYLETIRRLEKNIKFYQQLMECALPVLRKSGRLWDIDVIKSESEWNDDLQKWKIPEEILLRKKLPPAANNNLNEKYYNGNNSAESSGRKSTSLTAPGRLENSLLKFTSTDDDYNLNSFQLSSLTSSNDSLNTNKNSSYYGDYLENNSDSGNSVDSGHYNMMKKIDNIDNISIVDSYFRPRRANELLQQNRNNSIAYANKLYSHVPNYLNDANNFYQFRSTSNLNNYQFALNKTWSGAEGNHSNSD